DRRRDGGTYCRLDRVPHALRHGQGGREGHADRRHSLARKPGREVRFLPRRRSSRRQVPSKVQGVSMAALLSVADALARVLEGVKPLPPETAPLIDADGRVLAEDVAARRTQPPADLSAMDGYAVRAADVAS